MNKKLIETIISLVLLAAVVGVLIWFFITFIGYKKATGQAQLNLKQISVSQLEDVEKGPLVTLKTLKRFGNVPVVVPGGERSKSNPFLADSGETESPIYQAKNFQLSYPKSWSKGLDEDKNISFSPPLDDAGRSQGKMTVYYVNIDKVDGNSLSSAIRKKLQDIYNFSSNETFNFSDQSTENDKNNSIVRGRIEFSYQFNKEKKKGWIAGIAHQSPSSNLAAKIFDLAIKHKADSKILADILMAAKDKNDIFSILAKKTLIEELYSLEEDVKYNFPPYSGLVILVFDTNDANFSNFSGDADSIYNNIQFTEAVSGSAVQ